MTPSYPTNIQDVLRLASQRKGHTGTVVGPSRDRALHGKARRRARKAQNAEQRIARQVGQNVVRVPTVAIYGLKDLESMSVAMLKSTAKRLGIKGVSKLRQAELVEFIYQSEENQR